MSSIRTLGGIAAAAEAPPGGYQLFLGITWSDVDSRVEQRDCSIPNYLTTLDGQITIGYFNASTFETNTNTGIDIRLRTWMSQSFNLGTDYRISDIPIGSYLCDIGMGSGANAQNPEHHCGIIVKDGSGRSSGSTIEVHSASRTSYTQADVFWDGFDDGNLYTEAEWWARTIAPYPTGRAFPIDITSRSTTVQEGMNIQMTATGLPGTSTGRGALNYLRLWQAV